MLSKLITNLKNAVKADGLTAPAGEFVKGVNFGGNAVTIEGCNWMSYEAALGNGLSVPGATASQTSLRPHPYPPRNVRRMLNSVVFKPQTIELSQTLPNGSYEVYLWIMENYKSDWHALEISCNGQSIAKEVGKLPFLHWRRFGPYPATVTNAVLNLSISTNTPNVDAHVMGLSIFRPSSTKA